MLRPFVALTFGLLVTCSFGQVPDSQEQVSLSLPQPSPQQLFRSLSDSVFVVQSYNSKGGLIATGSAVSVTANKAITNCHVLRGGTQWAISQGNHQWPVSIVRRNSSHDLCEIASPTLTATPVTIRDSSDVKVGERVYALGAPVGLEASLSEGLVSGLRDESDGVLIQTTAPISHGSSGGGLFDAEGRLIGITTFGIRNSQNLNFALPSAWVLSLDSALQIAPTPSLTVTDADAVKTGATVIAPVTHSDPKGMFGLALHAAADAFDARDYEKAISLYSQALEMRPDDLTTMAMLAQVYISQDNYSAAQKLCSRVVSLDANSQMGWSCLGDAYLWQGSTDLAEAAFRKAVTLEPNDGSSWAGLGGALAAKRDRDGVLQVYEKLKTLNPDMANWFYTEVVAKMPGGR
jgi:Tfp pilus assembly protein PilF